MLFPVHNWLVKKTNRPKLSSILICSIILLLLILPSIFFFKTLIQESYIIYITIKQRLATGIIQGCEASICEASKEFFSIPEVTFQIERASRYITNYVINKGSDLIASIPTIIVNIFLMIFAMYYFLLQGPKLVERIGFYLSMKQKEYAKIITRLREVTKGILYGYVLVAFLQGILGGIGLWVFGVPSPLFWGIVMAFLALIPYLGTGFVWVPSALLLLFNGLSQNSNTLIFKGVGLFLYGFLVVSSVDNIIRPRIISDKAKIHPAIILVGIFGGLSMFGVFGVIIGPMVLSLAAIIVESYLGKQPSKKQLKKVFKDLIIEEEKEKKK
jgi:predicted PurR-regulated permease PerM